jgi:uncharacterized protein (TIGR00251 family)
VILSFYILPNSSENKLCGLHNGAIKLKLRAPPVEGAANQAIIEYLSEVLKIPKKNIEIKRGELSRNKQVELHVDVIDEALIKQKLGV